MGKSAQRDGFVETRNAEQDGLVEKRETTVENMRRILRTWYVADGVQRVLFPPTFVPPWLASMMHGDKLEQQRGGVTAHVVSDRCADAVPPEAAAAV